MTRFSSATREAVQQRATNRCEYCHVPDGHSIIPHQVDHIIPVIHQGSSQSDNLAWVCFACKSMKGVDVAGYDPVTNFFTPLFNPRLQAWHDQFDIDNGKLVGKTPVGRTTIRVLDLNHGNRVALRNQLNQDGSY